MHKCSNPRPMQPRRIKEIAQSNRRVPGISLRAARRQWQRSWCVTMETQTNHLLILVLALSSLHLPVAMAIKYINADPSITLNPSFDSDPSNLQLFGFQIAQFQQESGAPSVLVSSPRTNSSVPYEGGVWVCDVNANECDFETAFQERNIDLFDDPLRFELSPEDHSYERQLLGYTLKVLPNLFMVCAPLYIDTVATTPNGDPFSAHNGRCAFIQRNFSREALQLSVEEYIGLRLGGLDAAYLDTYLSPATSGIVMSSPLSPDSQGPSGEFVAAQLEPLPGFPRAAKIQTVDSSENQPVTPLLGFRVETGQFTKPMEQIVASAPRAANHRGQIIIEEITSGGIVQEFTIPGPGEAVDGYLGYDLAVLDLQANGYNSIVAGCPLCDADAGAVYVYVHSGDAATMFNITQKVPSPSTERGRFGMAVENIGDIDRDGYPDVAIAAPYNGDGVVYIYRGYSGGLVDDDYQVIRAAPDTKAFGFSLSGGLDLDNNSYPDLNIGELSGRQVLTYLSNPLVDVTLQFTNELTSLDLTEDRRCQSADNPDVVHICFDVTPCFVYNPVEGDVPRFALQYTLVADQEKRRVSQLENSASNSVTNRIELDAGVQNCTAPQTFIVGNDFTDTTPLVIDLEVTDSDQPIRVPSSGLGPVLVGVLNRYEREDTPRQLTLQQMIAFNVSCGPDGVCEPNYTLVLSDDGDRNTGPTGGLVLAENNIFGYKVRITNRASEDGLNPQLVFRYTEGLLFHGFEAITGSAASECLQSQNESVRIVCHLRNPFIGGSQVELRVFFRFDLSVLSLDEGSISLEMDIIDGASNIVQGSDSRTIRLEAVGGYNVTVFVNEESYVATRLINSQEDIPLNETGPLVGFSVQVRHSRRDTDGTTIPRSTLAISLPTEFTLDEGEDPLPLFIPTDIIPDPTTNCSYATNAIPSDITQLPSTFDIPQWEGPLPAPHPACSEGGVTCGVILCTIRNLQPNAVSADAADTFVELEFFGRLYSPSVKSRLVLSIYAEVSNDSSVVTIVQDDNTADNNADTFLVLPAVRESATDCIEYWIVVVSIIAGIVVLCLIIFILACLGLFRRWYKRSKEEEATMWVDQPDDDEFVYRRRTIPPIPGVTQGRSSPTLVAYTATGAENGDWRTEEDLEKEKEAEAEAELELQVQMSHFQPSSLSHSKSSSPPPIQAPVDENELEKYSYDPHRGVDDEYEGMETEI